MIPPWRDQNLVKARFKCNNICTIVKVFLLFGALRSINKSCVTGTLVASCNQYIQILSFSYQFKMLLPSCSLILLILKTAIGDKRCLSGTSVSYSLTYFRGLEFPTHRTFYWICEAPKIFLRTHRLLFLQ